MEMLKMVIFVVKRYAVRKAKIEQCVLCRLNIKEEGVILIWSHILNNENYRTNTGTTRTIPDIIETYREW